MCDEVGSPEKYYNCSVDCPTEVYHLPTGSYYVEEDSEITYLYYELRIERTKNYTLTLELYEAQQRILQLERQVQKTWWEKFLGL